MQTPGVASRAATTTLDVRDSPIDRASCRQANNLHAVRATAEFPYIELLGTILAACFFHSHLGTQVG
jgi:hypothetical protein